MTGLINQVPKLEANILKATQQKLEAKMDPKLKADYEKIIVSGMRVALQGGKDGILAGLKGSKDPLKDCALGAVNLVTLLSKQARGTMPIEAAIPGAMALMLHALDFADRAGIVTVGNEQLDQATKYFTDAIFERLGITKKMLQTAKAKAEDMAKNPEQLQKLKYAAGVDVAPGAQPASPQVGVPQ